jgi:hypothetical protein
VHGNVELRRVELQRLRQEFPRPGDGVALVIIAEREVAEHLEKRSVTARTADVLDIGFRARHAQTALHGDRSRGGRRHFTEERGNELLHARDREQRRRHLIRHERRGRRMNVTLRNEKIDERTPQFLTRKPHGCTRISGPRPGTPTGSWSDTRDWRGSVRRSRPKK